MDAANPVDALSDILMEVPDLVTAFSVDGRYLFANEAAARFLESDPLSVIGCHWKDLGFPGEFMEPLMGRIGQVFESGKPQYFRTRTSEWRGNRPIDISLTPMRCSETGIVGVLIIARDEVLLAEYEAAE